MYKGAIFDLFHTLTGPMITSSPHPPTSQVLGVDSAVWDEYLFHNTRNRLIGEERDPYTIVKGVAHAIDPAIPDATIRAAVRGRVRRFEDILHAIPDENIDTLKTLRGRGIKLGLISNADVMEVANWEKSPLFGLFDVEMISCRVGMLKPEPEIYISCVERMGIRAEECLFVGDGGSGELEGARAVGMTPVLMSGMIETLYPERALAARDACDLEIRSIPEVLELISSQF